MKAGFGQFAILSAAASWALGTYSAYRDTSDYFGIVTGALALAALVSAVLWWRHRA